jgi:hypothetical protein
MAEPLIVEFPPETVDVINQLSNELKLDRVEIISRALGLLQLWADAQKNHHMIVERPIRPNQTVSSDEYEITVER